MRVLTWNLWWRFGPFEERQPAIEAEIARLQPDVVLLQEVWADDQGRDQAVELGRALDLHVARTTDPEGRPHEFGNAVLSRFPIIGSESTALSGPDGHRSHRSVLTAVLATPAGPQPFTVTHLAWQYDAGPLRVRQLEEVVDQVARHRSADTDAPPPILGGDLNATPDSDEVRRLTGAAEPYRPGLVFTDCWAAVGDGPGHTWSRDNPHAADALWPRRRLDYVFVAWPRPKPLCNPRSAELAGRDPIGGIVPSDHYGVLVDLDDRRELPDR